MPFWSQESRALSIIERVQAYRHFRTERLPLNKFIRNWLPGLKKDGLFVGVNWSGDGAMGYDMAPSDVVDRLASMHLRDGRVALRVDLALSVGWQRGGDSKGPDWINLASPARKLQSTAIHSWLFQSVEPKLAIRTSERGELRKFTDLKTDLNSFLGRCGTPRG